MPAVTCSKTKRMCSSDYIVEADKHRHPTYVEPKLGTSIIFCNALIKVSSQLSGGLQALERPRDRIPIVSRWKDKIMWALTRIRRLDIGFSTKQCCKTCVLLRTTPRTLRERTLCLMIELHVTWPHSIYAFRSIARKWH